MLTITQAEYTSPTVYMTDFLLDLETYTQLSQRITDQYLKNIEVPGFRKGNAPKDKALQKADLPYLENLIVNEAISRNLPEAEKMIREITQDRHIMGIGLVQEEDAIAQTDQGFKFKLFTNLLPDMDLTGEGSWTAKAPTVAELPPRLNLNDFIARETEGFLRAFNQFQDSDKAIEIGTKVVLDIEETDLTSATPANMNPDVNFVIGTKQFPEEFEAELIGLKKGDKKEFQLTTFNPNLNQDNTFKFKVEVKSTATGVCKSLTELFETNEMVKTSFVSEENLKSDLTKQYETDTEQSLQNLRVKRAVSAVVAGTPETDLDEDAVKAEITRIMAEFAKDEDPIDSFNAMQFPYCQPATKATLAKEVESYVRGEFKASKMFLVIYYMKVTEKVTESELTKFFKEISENPSKYGYSPDLKGDALKDRIFDTIIRNKATAWILNTVKFN
jgi:trigger factor